MQLVGFSSIIILALFTTVFASKFKYQKKTKNFVRGCYYTNWAQYRHGVARFLPENYLPGLCTHIFYAFATMNESFCIRSFEWNDETTKHSKGMYERVMDLKKLQPSLKVLLSFGGWTFSEKKKSLLKAMSSSKKNRQIFVSSALAFTKEHQFDGFDLDWEYPDVNDKDSFSFLLEEMSEVFHSNNLLLTAAVAASISKIDDGYDVSVMGKTLDMINVMTYDIHGSWEKKTGFNSPLYDDDDKLSMSSAAEYWISKGIPKQKLIVGFATYGRSWTLLDVSQSDVDSPGTLAKAGLYTQEAGFLAYYEVCSMLENGGKRHFDDRQKVPYVVQENQWVGFDDVDSFRIKLKWLRDNGYGGAFVWTLDLDDFNGICLQNNGNKYPLIKTIFEELTLSSLSDQYSELLSGTNQTDNVSMTTKYPNSQLNETSQLLPTILQSTTGVLKNGKLLTQDSNNLGLPNSLTAPTGTSSEERSRTANQPFECPTAGLHPDPESCSHFYSCHFRIEGHRMTCGSGLTFNPITKTCDWPNSTQCLLKSQN